MIDKFEFNTQQISVVTTIIGTVYVIANIVVFTSLSKILGCYVLSEFGLILFAVSLTLCPIPNDPWGILVLMCLGVGLGNGVLSYAIVFSLHIYAFTIHIKYLVPAFSAMGADVCSICMN